MKLPVLTLMWCFLLVFLTQIRLETVSESDSTCESPECLFYQRVFQEESKVLRTHQSGDDMILDNSYPLEHHKVTSKDGYIITLSRIPNGGMSQEGRNSKPPALLHHGFIADGYEWILNSVDKALGYRLADAGYDVWMVCNRGTVHSLGHTTVSWRTKRYWNFSFHEIAVFDIPVIIDYILQLTTQPQLHYLAHSMGCSAFFASMSMLPEYNSKIKAFIGLAPAVYVGNTVVPFKPARPFILGHQEMHDSFLQGPFIHPDFLPFMKIMGHLCSPQIISKKICFGAMEVVFGFDFVENHYDLSKEIIEIGLSSTSIKAFFHLMQLWKSGNFQRYDYLEKNFEMYGQIHPPLYDLNKVTAPVFLFCGSEDQLVSCKDVYHLGNDLPNLKEFHEINQTQFNHIDFLFASNINELLNDRVLEIVNSSTYGIKKD